MGMLKRFSTASFKFVDSCIFSFRRCTDMHATGRVPSAGDRGDQTYQYGATTCPPNAAASDPAGSAKTASFAIAETGRGGCRSAGRAAGNTRKPDLQAGGS